MLTRVSNDATAADKETKSLLKGLRIIETINRSPGMILAHIAASCRLPRTTTHRTLKTLEQHGFVYRDAATGRFFPFRRVLALSSGFGPLAQATVQVRDLFAQYAAQVAWPMHFTAPLLDGKLPLMRVEASTDHVSPLAVDKLLPGATIPLLQCAAGLAWLSAMPQQARDPIVARALQLPCDRPSQKRWEPALLEQALVLARRRGYADFDWMCRHTNMVGIALPVRIDAACTAVLTVRFASSAIAMPRAVDRFLPVLQHIARLLTAERDVSGDERAHFPERANSSGGANGSRQERGSTMAASAL